ncbi:MAG: hypothetical protein HXY24_15920, partial [Rubrivivax sp.]|nr:hypothetical protein [Rubrivivax sp.]
MKRNQKVLLIFPGVIFILGLLAAGPSPAADNEWTWLGPYGGKINTLAVDPQTPSTIYAGTDVGIFKSTDGGTNWTVINKGLTNLDIIVLAIDPKAPQTIYAGTNGGGLFKSSDGGANWAAANIGLTNLKIQSLAIDPVASSTLFAGTEGGVFKSTDRGAGWVLAGSGFRSDNILSLTITPQNPSIVYAGTLSGLYKTTDGGATWASTGWYLIGRLISSIIIHPANSSTLYAAGGDGIFLSGDGGVNWDYILRQSTTKTYLRGLVMNPQSPSILYAFEEGSIYPPLTYKSTDGGVNWTTLDSLSGKEVKLALNPASSSVLYAGTKTEGLLKSTNEGASWSNVGLDRVT